MKISYLSIGALAGILAATSALAVPTVKISRTAGTYTGSGGEFTITVGSENISYASYAAGPVALAGSKFQTFCVETLDYVTLGNNYNASVSKAINGNNGTKTLSQGAAWLYAQFLSGGLNGYNYTVGSGRAASAGLLQNTLWYLMGEASNPGGVFMADLTTAGFTTTTAQAAISGNYYETTIGNTIWDVAVLNLTTSTGGRAQDQLIAWSRSVPQNNGVPDGGTTVSMLGMALAGLGFIGRRFGKR